MIVIIPSNRQIELAHLTPLIESGARFLIIDDSEGTISLDHPQMRVFNWRDRRRILGDLDQYFPRKNGVARVVGFAIAWRESDPGESIIALDDDCRVYRKDFAEEVERSLSNIPRPMVTTPGDHLNILDLYAGSDGTLFPRGFPYTARADYCGATIGSEESRNVLFSLGMWRGVYDINAVDKISGPKFTHPEASLRHRSVIIAPGKLVSVCSMNMQFRREVLPAAYQFPMNIEVLRHGVIDRYGDIWGGFVLKTLMDLKGDALTVGEPMVEHLKDGNVLRNVWQENLAHQVNDEFLRLLARARGDLKAASYLEMMAMVREVFAKRREEASPLLRRYLDHVIPALSAWIAWFQ